MDPLSISVSIAGLSVAAVQVSHLLRNFVDSTHQAPKTARHVLMETTGIYGCLNQLDAFLTGRQESSRSRRSLIMIEKVIIIFTDCVSIFSELEQVLETLKTDGPMRVIDKMKSSKISLNLMLTILTCNSLERAEESTRGLATGIELLLQSNLNMSRRLHNIERMHPALAASSNASRASSIFTSGSIQGDSRDSEISFEKALETSPAYKRAGYRQIRKSTKTSSMVSPGPSLLSRLSLGDVENVSAIALPIASRELWNHHRYSTAQNKAVEANRETLDAWYYPPPNRCAFIRTAYFNGQYTNQYTQPKFQGHLIYRRFSVGTPHTSPVFTEGAAILPSIQEDVAYRDCENRLNNDVAELEGSACQNPNPPWGNVAELPAHQTPGEGPWQSFTAADSAAKWRQSVLGLLESTYRSTGAQALTIPIDSRG